MTSPTILSEEPEGSYHRRGTFITILDKIN